MSTLSEQLLALKRPRLSQPDLSHRIDAHLAAAATCALTSPLVDLHTATAIHAACAQLLSDWPQLDPEQRLWTQAACLYFADPDEDQGEPDFDSIVGFDDDLDALNHCLERIGRPTVHP